MLTFYRVFEVRNIFLFPFCYQILVGFRKGSSNALRKTQPDFLVNCTGNERHLWMDSRKLQVIDPEMKLAFHPHNKILNLLATNHSLHFQVNPKLLR